MGYWGVQPSEFWTMSLPEWFAIYDMKAEESRSIKQRGPPQKLTDEERARYTAQHNEWKRQEARRSG